MAKKNDPAPKELKDTSDSSLAPDDGDDGDERGFLVPDLEPEAEPTPDPEPADLTPKSIPEPTPEPESTPSTPAPVTPSSSASAVQRRVLYENVVNEEAAAFARDAQAAYTEAKLAGKGIRIVVDDPDDEATDSEGG